MSNESNKKGAVLIPESQLTDAELEEVSGGLLTIESFQVKPKLHLPPFPNPSIGRMPIAAGCGTDDSGAMGCPG